MTCNVEISKFKKNAILFRDENGKIICLTKEEFLKEQNDKIKDLEFKLEQKTNELNAFKEKVEIQLEEKTKQIDAHLNAIHEFISIMKGGK